MTLVLIFARAPAAETAAATTNGATSRPAPAYTIHMATSDDGLRFVKTESILIRNAATPALIRLPRGDVLAVFEHAGSDGRVGLSATRSTDGERWLPARPIQLQGLPDEVQVSHPTLVSTPDGHVNLFFCASQTMPETRRRESRTPIRTAITRNGLSYDADQTPAVEYPGRASAQPIAFGIPKGVLMFVASQAGPGSRDSSTPAVHQFLSKDGRSFSPPDRARFTGAIGHVLQLDEHHWRMYIARGIDIRSRMSNDGIRWRDEEGVRLPGGIAPAVVQLRNRRYLMLYCTPEDAKETSTVELARVVPDKLNPEQPTPTKPRPTSPGQDGWSDFGPSIGLNSLDGASIDAQHGSDTGADFFAPMPDFINHFDYIGWFEQNRLVPADQNAFYTYGDLPERMKALTPEDVRTLFNDMYNSDTRTGPPAPWSPGDHPEWEASYQATQDLVSLFRGGATSGLAYSTPLHWPDTVAPEDRLLVNLDLSPMAGFRRMTRAVLSQAWRAENGVVPPANMRDALEVGLGNAVQVDGGATLIERLVSCAERNLVEDTARWALHQNVFATPEEMEATLNLLEEKDTPSPDPAGWVAGETAWVKDLAQYVYVPDENGRPKLDPERTRKAASIIDGTPAEQVELPPEVLETTIEQAQAVINEVDGYYQRLAEVWRSSYPGPLSESTDLLAQEINERNPMAGKVLASGDRAYHLMRRTEASRRATQLVYRVELFRARNGRHPSSLNELPADEIADIRTDPFSSQDFAYRLTESGPVIYSTSVNGFDDGGLHSPNWGDREDGSGSDDFVFWPPQR